MAFRKRTMERARAKTHAAIKSGKLQKQPCRDCGDSLKVDAHHTDYRKPLQVVWLCRACHKAEHMRLAGKTVRASRPTLPKPLSADDGTLQLFQFVQQSGNHIRAARSLGVPKEKISGMLSGRQKVSDEVLSKMGFERVTVPIDPQEIAALMAEAALAAEARKFSDAMLNKLGLRRTIIAAK
jgi:hypothetical protein